MAFFGKCISTLEFRKQEQAHLAVPYKNSLKAGQYIVCSHKAQNGVKCLRHSLLCPQW